MTTMLADEVVALPDVTLHIVKDATDPVGTCKPTNWPWFDWACLADYVPRDLALDKHTSLRLNGHPINRDRWDREHPLYKDHSIEPGDEIHIFAIPGGLGVLLAGALGSAFATFNAAGAITGLTTLGIIVAGVTEAIIGAGLSYLSSLLVDTAVDVDSLPDYSYGAGGIQNQNVIGAPICIIYGKKRKAGTLIRYEIGHAGGLSWPKGKYSQMQSGGGRTLVQYGLCEGPVKSIGGVLVPMNRHWFSTSSGQRRIVYNNIGYPQTGEVDIRGGPAKQTIAFAFHVTGEPAYVTHITLKLKRHGTIAAGKKIWVSVQGTYANLPSNVDIIPPIYKDDLNSIPQNSIDVLFKLPDPVQLSVNLPDYPYWVVIHGDYNLDAFNFIGLQTTIVQGWGNVIWWNGSAWDPYLQFFRTHTAVAQVACQPNRYQGDSGEIKIDGSAIEAFTNEGNVSSRLGTREQDEMPTISKVAFAQPIDLALVQWKPTTATTETEVNGFAVVYYFSGGHYRINSKGGYEGARFYSVIKWRINGQTNWTGYDFIDTSLFYIAPDVFTHRIDFTKDKGLEQYIGEVIDVEVTLVIPGSTDQKGTIYWKFLNEYNDTQAQTHPLLAYLQLELDLPSSQGAISVVTALIEGKIMEVFDGSLYRELYSDYPADCCRDYLLAPRYGMGDLLHRGNVDDSAFAEWRDECLTSIQKKPGEPTVGPKYTLALDINQVEPTWDQAVRIAAVGRAKLVFWGNKVRPKVDKHREYRQLFNAGNIEPGTFKITFIGKRKRPNVIDVKFWDVNNEDNVAYGHAEDDSLRESYEPDVIETVELKGCPEQYQADRYAQYLLNQSKYIGFVAEWTSFLESIHCEPGDNAFLANDAPQWETVHGKIVANSSGNGVQIDQPLTIDASGYPYRITVQVVDDVDGLEYFEHRTIDETGPVSFDAGDVIDVTPSFTANRYPKIGDRYSIRPIRTHDDPSVECTEPGALMVHIVKMRPLQDFRVKVQVTQYDSRVHDDTPLRKVQERQDNFPVYGNKIPPPPRNLSFRMEPSQRPGFTRATMRWEKPTWVGPYSCEIWVRLVGIDNDRFYRVDETWDDWYVWDPLTPGTTWDVAIVPLGFGKLYHWNPNDTKHRTEVKRVFIQRFYDPRSAAFVVPQINF